MRPFKTIQLLTLIAAFGSLAIGPQLDAQLFKRKTARVVVDATASSSFDEIRKASPDGLKYILMEGKFFGGETRDKSLETMPFIDIATEIAKRLESKKMFSTSNIDEAKILLVISWGTTDIPFDWGEITGETEIGETTDGFESEEENSTFPESTSGESVYPDRSTQNVEASTARLIGIDRAINKNGLTQQDFYELQMMLREERYFIAVQAFDFDKFKAKDGLHLLWATRFSMGAAGANFDEAYLSLARSAAPYFGENLDEIEHTKTNLGSGEAKVGELEVIGTGETTDDIE